MPSKPVSMIYNLNDRPPWSTTLTLALQHAVLPVTYAVYAVIVGQQADLDILTVQSMTAMVLLATAAGTFLQALGRKGMGSGYVIAQVPSSIYLPLSIKAASLGGLPLLAGMTLFAGLAEMLISRVMHRLRAVFPPEVCGTVVTMVGLSLAEAAASRFFILDMRGFQLRGELICSFGTFFLLVVLSVWGRGIFKLMSLLISLFFGCLLSYYMGLFPEAAIQMIQDSPLVHAPSLMLDGFAFSPHLAPTFLVAAVTAAVHTSGLVITSQKINDPAWKRADMKEVAGGVLTDGMGTAAAGLLGTVGTNTSPTSVGLTLATGASSRVIGMAAGAMLVGLAFLPRFCMTLAFLPRPVLGAILVYTVCVVTVAGLKLITSRLMDMRRTFLVGLSLLAGLTSMLHPELAQGLPSFLARIYESPVTLAATLAITLNIIFRLGISQNVRESFPPTHEGASSMEDFLEQNLESWGVLPDVAYRSHAAARELFEMLMLSERPRGDLTLNARFDEFNLNLVFSYQGTAPDLAASHQEAEDILDVEGSLERLAATLIRSYADKAEVRREGEHVSILLHFAH